MVENVYDELSCIQDTVLNLGDRLYLKMCVKLERKDFNGNRKLFHDEVKYRSITFTDKSYSRNIKRNFDYFLLIERKVYNGDPIDVDCYIQIRPANMIYLCNILDICTQWLFDDKLYMIKNNQVFITKRIEMKKLFGLNMNGWIGFEPCIIIDENTNTYDKGVRFYLSSESKFMDIRADNFLAFVYTIKNFNMYAIACEMVNYIQRPDFGTNLYEMHDTDYVNDNNNGMVQGQTGNTIQSRKKVPKSFFDRLDEL